MWVITEACKLFSMVEFRFWRKIEIFPPVSGIIIARKSVSYWFWFNIYKARSDCNSMVMVHMVKIAELGSKKDYEKRIKRIYVSLLSLLYYTILYSSVNDGLQLKSWFSRDKKYLQKYTILYLHKWKQTRQLAVTDIDFVTLTQVKIRWGLPCLV